MKVSGFTFIKNAQKYGYPVVESVKSVLPLVDEMFICAGDSDDETNELIASIGDGKIKVINSVWDSSLRKGGKVLAMETNKAKGAVDAEADWLFYIQADEVLHEKYYPVIRDAMEKYKDDKKVEGLLFNYHHFFGSYQYIADGRKWYSKEIRIIRNDKQILSYRDAQGFRKKGRKLNVKLINAWIYHYGWVRNPLIMFQKNNDFGKFWTKTDQQEFPADLSEKKVNKFDYSDIDTVMLFQDTHPGVMKEQLARENWDTKINVKRKKFKNLKHWFLYLLWQKTGWRPFEYSNYRIIR